MKEVCKNFKWPTDDLTPAERCAPVANYDEGPFLTMLFNKLSRILSQPYAVNLVVTSIASRLSLVPHPLLHEICCDPLTPLRPKARSIYTVLLGGSDQVKQRICHVSHFKTRIASARRNLTNTAAKDDNKII